MAKTKISRKDVLKMTDAQIDKVVKIQGTKFDRKRKISDRTIASMKRMAGKGISVKEIAKKLDISPFMIKYHTDDTFRAKYNFFRSGKHTGVDTITPADRAQYKRDLVESRKKVIIEGL